MLAANGFWDSFLQGSYRNATATAQINDVDIVALRHLRSGKQTVGTWEEFFARSHRLYEPHRALAGLFSSTTNASC